MEMTKTRTTAMMETMETKTMMMNRIMMMTKTTTIGKRDKTRRKTRKRTRRGSMMIREKKQKKRVKNGEKKRDKKQDQTEKQDKIGETGRERLTKRDQS